MKRYDQEPNRGALMRGSMFGDPTQGLLFDVPPPSREWTEASATQALDELFLLAGHYRSSQTYFELAKFIAHFHFYSPYNAMLLHIQLPGATFVATPTRWMEKYGRRIKPDARPLVILCQ
jgi:hypothetical protein